MNVDGDERPRRGTSARSPPSRHGFVVSAGVPSAGRPVSDRVGRGQGRHAGVFPPGRLGPATWTRCLPPSSGSGGGSTSPARFGGPDRFGRRLGCTASGYPCRRGTVAQACGTDRAAASGKAISAVSSLHRCSLTVANAWLLRRRSDASAPPGDLQRRDSASVARLSSLRSSAWVRGVVVAQRGGGVGGSDPPVWEFGTPVGKSPGQSPVKASGGGARRFCSSVLRVVCSWVASVSNCTRKAPSCGGGSPSMVSRNCRSWRIVSRRWPPPAEPRQAPWFRTGRSRRAGATRCTG